MCLQGEVGPRAGAGGSRRWVPRPFSGLRGDTPFPLSGAFRAGNWLSSFWNQEGRGSLGSQERSSRKCRLCSDQHEPQRTPRLGTRDEAPRPSGPLQRTGTGCRETRGDGGVHTLPGKVTSTTHQTRLRMWRTTERGTQEKPETKENCPQATRLLLPELRLLTGKVSLPRLAASPGPLTWTQKQREALGRLRKFSLQRVTGQPVAEVSC